MISNNSISNIEKYLSRETLTEIIKKNAPADFEDNKQTLIESCMRDYDQIIKDMFENTVKPLQDAFKDGKRYHFDKIPGGFNSQEDDDIIKSTQTLCFLKQTCNAIQVSLKEYSFEQNEDSERNTTSQVARKRLYLPEEVVNNPTPENIGKHKEELRNLLPQINKIKFSAEVNNEVVFPDISLADLPPPRQEDVARNELRKNPALSNFSITLQNGNTFMADKVTLAMNSPFFRKLFTSSFEEKENNIASMNLDSDIAPELFEQYLEFIYTKSIKLSDNLEDIIALGTLADMTAVDDLKTLCTKKLCLMLTKETFLKIAVYAQQTNDELLKERCVLFIKSHPKWLERNAERFHAYDLNELLNMLHVARFVESEDFGKAICQEIEKKIDYTNFKLVCNKAAHFKLLKKLCKNFAQSDSDFMKNASKETLEAYIQLTSGVSVQLAKQ